MNRTQQVRLTASALALGLITGCASTPAPAPEPEQPTPTRLQKASYVETACQSASAFALISGIGLPGYLVVSSFANRACSAVGAGQ